MLYKKAILHHPWVWMLAAFVLGVLLTYLAAQNVIPFPFPICPACK